MGQLEVGNEDEALANYRETLRIERLVLGDSHHDVILTTFHMGQVHVQLGEVNEALECFHSVLKVQKEAAERDYLAIGRTLNHIGNVYLRIGKVNEVVATMSEAVRYFRLGGKDENDLEISGFNLYRLSKEHPECAPVA